VHSSGNKIGSSPDVALPLELLFNPEAILVVPFHPVLDQQAH